MLRFLSEKNLWQALRTISKGRRGKLFVAVPYIGPDAGKLSFQDDAIEETPAS